MRPTLDYVLERDEWVCWICQEAIPDRDSASRDHVAPVSRKGPNILVTVRSAHRVCNMKRGAPIPTPDEFHWESYSPEQRDDLRAICRRFMDWWMSTTFVPAAVIRFSLGVDEDPDVGRIVAAYAS